MGKRRNTTRKALRMESLEARQLMAADIGLHHGILNVRGTHQDDVIKMEQVQVGQSNQENSIIKVSVANKRGRVLKAAQFDARAVKKIKAYGYNGHDRITNNTRIPSYLQGGKGNDMLQGGSAIDKVFGSYGNDTLRGGAGNDKLYGGSGHDRIYGNSGKDTLRGGAGNDKIYGGSGHDKIYGNSGNDYLSGASGNDRIYAGSGNDVAHGGRGNDVIRGADGKDHLYAGVGRDKLYGDRGQDVLHKSSSRDLANGGQGHDRITRDRKATSTAAARKVHEVAQEKLEAKISSDKIDKITSQLVDSVLSEVKEETASRSGNQKLSRVGGLDSILGKDEKLTGNSSNYGKAGVSDKRNPLNNQSSRTTVKGSRGSQVSTDPDDDFTPTAMGITGTAWWIAENAKLVASWHPAVRLGVGAAFAIYGASQIDVVQFIPDSYFEDKTPAPNKDDFGDGFVFAPDSFLGKQERVRKWGEIVSNMSGYGLWDPNPADESESGGGVHNPKNHDDGGNHVKEKAESAGSAKDIEVSAGGGVTDPPFDKDRVKLKAKSWKK